MNKWENLNVVQGQYGQGWEDLCAATDRKEARDDLRAYRENEPRTPTRLIRRRVRVLCRWCGKVAEECTGSGYADDIPAHDFKPGL